MGGNQNFWINADGVTTGHVDHIPVRQRGVVRIDDAGVTPD
ncbi:hypothetical protein [Candidatus Coxiella mudrowiae]|nr:hypothetical protein [Candidatus Coxiella mudrowiae]